MNKQLTESFARWYQHYGRKQNVGKARAAFEKLAPDSALVDKMIEAADFQKDEYLKANGPQSGANAWKYMALPASWINAEAYENEVVAKQEYKQKNEKMCNCGKPATNKGKLGMWFCVDHWDGGDRERADRLRENFIKLGIRQDENGWKGPCLAAMKRMALGGLVGGVK